MVGKWGQCYFNYKTAAFWQNLEYKYAGKIFFIKLCQAGENF